MSGFSQKMPPTAADWLPMKSAPRDGSRVILFAFDYVFIGRWGKDRNGIDNYFGWVPDDALNYRTLKRARGWMPLPGRPK